MPFKCFLCPGKKPTLKADALQCSNRGVYYHPGCAERAKVDSKGVFKACCRNENKKNNLNSHMTDSWNAEADEEEFDKLDINGKILFKLLCNKMEGMEERMKGVVDDIKNKVSEIEERVDLLEESTVDMPEKVISELNDRKFREKNIIIYNLVDSVKAYETDLLEFKKLIKRSKVAYDFNINSVKSVRLGKYVSGKDRPLKIILPKVEDVYWVLQNKKDICHDNISIAKDLTLMQRKNKAKVIKELKDRKEMGEESLIIKYVGDVPKIVKVNDRHSQPNSQWRRNRGLDQGEEND